MLLNGLTESILDNQQADAISVGDFFRQINWYGEVLSASDTAEEADSPYETVGQFFGTFPWQGTTASMPSEDWDELGDDEFGPVDKDTLTLEDLSALF